MRAPEAPPWSDFWGAWAWIGEPPLALLRQPVLLAGLALLIGIVALGLFNQLGAPLQFFHDCAKVQRRAGFVATLTVAQVFFVLYLAESTRGLRAWPTLAWFLGVWGLTVMLAVGARLHPIRDDGTQKAPLAPGLREVVTTDDAEGGPTSALGAHAVLNVGPWPFVQGVSLALGLVAVAVAVLLLVLGRFEAWAAPAWQEVVHFRRSVFGITAPSHAGLHALALFAFAVQMAIVRRRLGAAGALCVLIALVSALVGAAQFWTNGQALVALLALGALCLAGRELYKLRVADLAPLYEPRHRVPYPPATAPTDDSEPLLADQLVSSGQIPSGWGDGLPEKRPLIIVCVSGGGLRAATWTAGILGRLREEVPDFRRLTLLVTGASGGMVGASHWLATLDRDTQPSWQELLRRVAKDSLTDMLRTFALNDVPKAFKPELNLEDRSRVLQASWTDSQGNADLEIPLVALKAGERERRWPSLVFSPMIVEDGRRLLLGNLRLTKVVESAAPWLGVDTRNRPEAGTASISAFHAADVFGAASRALTLGTAARLSAAFPYISPAVVLPTLPRTRVVDAGYYDNFGMDLATGFLREALEQQASWLEEHVSRVLVVQVQDEASRLGKAASDERVAAPLPGDKRGLGARLARALEGFTSPLQGLFAARTSVMRLRNDAQFEAVSKAYDRRFGEHFVLTEVFQLQGELSMSWYLSRDERKAISDQLGSPGITHKLGRVGAWVAGTPSS